MRRSSLFLQVYLLIVACLAIAVVVLVTMSGLGRFDQKNVFEANFGRIVGALINEDGGKRDINRTVEKLSNDLNADVSVYGRDGHLIAHSGNILPYRSRAMEPGGFRSAPRTLVFDADGGARIIARMRAPMFNARRSFAWAVIIIAAAVAAAAYPATRRLTRRLTALNNGMERWSLGALDTRVEAKGSDEIAEVARTFNQAASRIEDLINAQKNLLANASHELRSPLARLRMAAEIYQDTPSDRLKSEILTNLSELDELVEEILLMSRLESQADQPKDDHVDLLSLAAEEAASVNADVSGERAKLVGNARLLRRMVRNLLQNASRHGKPPIEVSLAVAGNTVTLTVRDHGPGIAENDRERVFEPFFRPAGRAESAGGWGLGLALVREIAELHDGTVTYEAGKDAGAGFVVTLPARS